MFNLCVFVCICVHGSCDRAKPKFQPPGRKGTFPCKKSLVKTKKDNNGLLVYIQRRAFPFSPQKHTQLCPSDDSTFFFHAGLPCREPLWTLQRMYFLHHDQKGWYQLFRLSTECSYFNTVKRSRSNFYVGLHC